VEEFPQPWAERIWRSLSTLVPRLYPRALDKAAAAPASEHAEAFFSTLS